MNEERNETNETKETTYDAIFEEVRRQCERAKAACAGMSALSAGEKNALLCRMAQVLESDASVISSANLEDLRLAEAGGMSPSMLDRLRFSEERIAASARDMRAVAELPDPCGSGERTVRPNGLEITRVRVPIGVVGMIYEARPNVTADAAALAVKTGNAVVLRGGKEAIRTNRATVAALRRALGEAGAPEDAVCLVTNTDRESSAALMRQRGLVDVLIPRGGKGLIRRVVEEATVPTIETGAGNCHIYVDESADLSMALTVLMNAKTSRPSVCNAAESLLLHRSVADRFLPMLDEACRGRVELRGCDVCRSVIPSMTAATEEDYATEYDDLILSVKVVDDLSEAIWHINRYGTGHSEAIITRSRDAARRFCREVDAACVYVNASTRFTDGGEFGFGAEIGISTQKLHARGPMGLTALTTEKYLIEGDGQIR